MDEKETVRETVHETERVKDPAEDHIVKAPDEVVTEKETTVERTGGEV